MELLVLVVIAILIVWTRRVVRRYRATTTDERVTALLQEHYKQVLSSPEGRAMWRTLIEQAEAAEQKVEA